ncbi:uncharacterized protein LOC142566588 [Dermacentor variabilis]|uniref:uncharacterized protein LOC142566588 n=1 Tax=Dermacentor variabilis TaxID=34621 RepID=UPI003F5AE681
MLTKVRSLCGGEKLSKSMVLTSMDTLPSVVQASVVDVAGHAENSIGVPCHAFIGHLDTVFQPGNFASLLNYMGFRALLHLSAAVPGREELVEARLEEITGRAQYRWPRPLACLRLAEALLPTLFLHDHYAWFFNDSTITAKDALVEWFVKNLPNVAKYSPWGSTPAYIRKIQHHVDSMRLRRYLPSWLFNAEKRRRFNEQLQAEHTFLNDNKDVFAALTILPPNLPVEPTAMSSTLTAEQLYYVYYGLGRCVWMRSEHLRTTIESRFFSPPRYRLNLPLRNSRHFRRAWKCGPPSCLLPSDDSL